MKKVNIITSEWRVTAEFRHSDVIYSLGESVPVMTLAEADVYRKAGVIARTGEVVEEAHPGVQVTSLDSYLQGPDAVVLRIIRVNHPTLEDLVQIRDLAIKNGRSPLLIEALRCLVWEPVE